MSRSREALEIKMETVYALLSMFTCNNIKEEMCNKFYSMSQDKRVSLEMRTCGCIPLLIQLIHPFQNNQTINSSSLAFSDLRDEKKSLEIRSKACLALYQIISSNDDSKKKELELSVLSLLDEIRKFSEKFLRLNSETNLNINHPFEAISQLLKLSFNQEFIFAISLLGGLQALSELIYLDTKFDKNANSLQCITTRRYTLMILTNLTFQDSFNKSNLCSNRSFIECLVQQFESNSEELKQVTASLIRNLSWKTDESSKIVLQETVQRLTQAALETKKESTLQSILTALWNLSAHSATNKAMICSIEGALQFLIFTLTYQSANNSLVIIENGGGILRNISNHIAKSERYRSILREHNCLSILLNLLKSPSLTIVSNTCATLWNLSAHCLQDQQTLIELGAFSMLSSLVNSKHKMISMGSSAALKNLSSSRLFFQVSSPYSIKSFQNYSQFPTLKARKLNYFKPELDESLAETCDNLDSPKTNNSNHCNCDCDCDRDLDSPLNQFDYSYSSTNFDTDMSHFYHHLDRRCNMSKLSQSFLSDNFFTNNSQHAEKNNKLCQKSQQCLKDFEENLFYPKDDSYDQIFERKKKLKQEKEKKKKKREQKDNDDDNDDYNDDEHNEGNEDDNHNDNNIDDDDDDAVKEEEDNEKAKKKEKKSKEEEMFEKEEPKNFSLIFTETSDDDLKNEEKPVDFTLEYNEDSFNQDQEALSKTYLKNNFEFENVSAFSSIRISEPNLTHVNSSNASTIGNEDTMRVYREEGTPNMPSSPIFHYHNVYTNSYKEEFDFHIENKIDLPSTSEPSSSIQEKSCLLKDSNPFSEEYVKSFNQTPLMYSRTSSIDSLTDCDVKSVENSTYNSESSRTESEPSSPFDIPDSPLHQNLFNIQADDEKDLNDETHEAFYQQPLQHENYFHESSTPQNDFGHEISKNSSHTNLSYLFEQKLSSLNGSPEENFNDKELSNDQEVIDFTHSSKEYLPNHQYIQSETPSLHKLANITENNDNQNKKYEANSKNMEYKIISDSNTKDTSLKPVFLKTLSLVKAYPFESLTFLKPPFINEKIIKTSSSWSCLKSNKFDVKDNFLIDIKDFDQSSTKYIKQQTNDLKILTESLKNNSLNIDRNLKPKFTLKCDESSNHKSQTMCTHSTFEKAKTIEPKKVNLKLKDMVSKKPSFSTSQKSNHNLTRLDSPKFRFSPIIVKPTKTSILRASLTKHFIEGHSNEKSLNLNSDKKNLNSPSSHNNRTYVIRKKSSTSSQETSNFILSNPSSLNKNFKSSKSFAIVPKKFRIQSKIASLWKKNMNDDDDINKKLNESL